MANPYGHPQLSGNQMQHQYHPVNQLRGPVLTPEQKIRKYNPITGQLLPDPSDRGAITAHTMGQGALSNVQQLTDDAPKIGAAIYDGVDNAATAVSLGGQNFLRGALGKKEVDEENMVNLTPNLVGQYLGRAGQSVYDNVINPALEVGADYGTDFVEGTLNAGLGILGKPPIKEGFRYRNGLENPSENIASSGVLAPTHTMPDGTVMAGATHEDYTKGILENAPVVPNDGTGTATDKEITTLVGNDGVVAGNDDVVAGNNGVLTQDNSVVKTEDKTSRKDGILTKVGEAASVDRSGTTTGNKRDAAALSVPRQKIELSEMLMRVGGAITGSSDKGALASIGAGTNVYGAIQDENRAMEMQQYEADQKAYDAEENRKVQTLVSKRANSATMKDAIEKGDAFVARTMRIDSIDSLITDLTAAGDTISGPIQGRLHNVYDRMRGNPEANIRLRMEEQRVDAALTMVEKTKGAISNREMDLFLSPMPKMTDGEEVWIDWLTMQRNVATKMNQIASGGIDANGRYVNAVEEDAPLSPELEAYLAKYPAK